MVRLIQVYANNILYFSRNKTILHKIVMNYLLTTLLCYLIVSIWFCFFFTFFVFLYIIKYIPDIFRAIKEISVNEVRDFLCKKYYQLTGFSKGRSFIQ